jgi:hypothetical protein
MANDHPPSEPSLQDYRRNFEPLISAAVQEARGLGHDWVGPAHFVLAILSTRADSPSVVALEAAGVTRMAIVQRLTEGDDDGLNDGGSVSSVTPSLTPSSYALLGRADGLAAGMGAVQITTEHLLLAYLWDQDTAHDVDPTGGGEVRSALVARLKLLDVPMPRLWFSHQRPSASGPPVLVRSEDLMPIVRILQTSLPADSGLGFNEDGHGGAWISAREGVDLESRIAEILQSLDSDG